MSSAHTTPATRQELLKLRARIKTAGRGKSLLKDKRDSLVREFLRVIHKALDLRRDFDEQYQEIQPLFIGVRGAVSHTYIRSLRETPTTAIALSTTLETIMSVAVPRIRATVVGNPAQYSFAQTPEQLDVLVLRLRKIVPLLIELIEYEHAALKLAQEIEKTRRRVNALEHVIIPSMQAHNKYIRSKLEERDREATVALMKLQK